MQLVIQSASQPVSQLFWQSVGQSVSRSLSQPVSQLQYSGSQLVSQFIIGSFSLSSTQLVNQLVGQPVY